MKKIIFLFALSIMYDCSRTLNGINEIKENDTIYGIRAIDGNTFRAYNSDKSKIFRVDIYGVNSPEIGDEFFNPSMTYLDSLISNEKLTIRNIIKKDNLGDETVLTADVFISDDKNLAIQILKEGLAESDKSVQDNNYVNAQVLAMKAEKGKWIYNK